MKIAVVVLTLLSALTNCTIVSRNRAFPGLAWDWSQDAKDERDYDRANIEFIKLLNKP